MFETNDMILDVYQTVDINSTIEEAYAGLIHRLTVGSVAADNQAMPLTLEAWPGGRWFRDLGDEQGHLWGFVQVIKPPTLIEIQGPTFMSYPVAGHIRFRLEETDSGVELSLHHRAFGLIDDQHREGVVPGWASVLEGTKRYSEGKS